MKTTTPSLGSLRLPMAACPFLLIPYDSLTHLLGIGEETGAQSFPATAALSLVYIALRGPTLRWSRQSVRVFACLASVFLAMLLLTAGNLMYESSQSTDLQEAWRIQTALRQGVSFVLGLTTFAMFQDALLRVGHGAAFRWMIIGSLPSFVLLPFQAFTGAFRVQGFSSEPSYLGDMLAFSFLPAVAAAKLPTQGMRRALMFLGVLTLFSTFSSTGFMKLALVLLCYFVSTGRALRGLVLVTLAFTITYGLLSLWPENYVFSTFSELYSVYQDSGELLNITFLDRYMALMGPLSMLNRPIAWLGMGLGADSVYFDHLFDAVTAEAIRSVKWGAPSITSLQGKTLMYAGVWGYLAYLGTWAVAWKSAPRKHPARFMLPAVFLASLFSLSPFFIPYVWLWLAFGATAGASGMSANIEPTPAFDPRKASA